MLRTEKIQGSKFGGTSLDHPFSGLRGGKDDEG